MLDSSKFESIPEEDIYYFNIRYNYTNREYYWSLNSVVSCSEDMNKLFNTFRDFHTPCCAKLYSVYGFDVTHFTEAGAKYAFGLYVDSSFVLFFTSFSNVF